MAVSRINHCFSFVCHTSVPNIFISSLTSTPPSHPFNFRDESRKGKTNFLTLTHHLTCTTAPMHPRAHAMPLAPFKSCYTHFANNPLGISIPLKIITTESSKWLPAGVCSDCFEYLRQKQWSQFEASVAKADCRAEVLRLCAKVRKEGERKRKKKKKTHGSERKSPLSSSIPTPSQPPTALLRRPTLAWPMLHYAGSNVCL